MAIKINKLLSGIEIFKRYDIRDNIIYTDYDELFLITNLSISEEDVNKLIDIGWYQSNVHIGKNVFSYENYRKDEIWFI